MYFDHIPPIVLSSPFPLLLNPLPYSEPPLCPFSSMNPQFCYLLSGLLLCKQSPGGAAPHGGM